MLHQHTIDKADIVEAWQAANAMDADVVHQDKEWRAKMRLHRKGNAEWDDGESDSNDDENNDDDNDSEKTKTLSCKQSKTVERARRPSKNAERTI